VGAVGSIELMVAMAVVVIATFNLEKVPLALSFFIIVHCLGFDLPKRYRGTISDGIFLLLWLFITYFKCKKAPQTEGAFASCYLVLDLSKAE
jgi:hypothetical protein